MEEKKGVKETVNEILEANGIQLQKRLSTTQAMDLIKNLSHMIMWRTTSGGSNLGQEIKNMNETFQIDDLQTMQKLEEKKKAEEKKEGSEQKNFLTAGPKTTNLELSQDISQDSGSQALSESFIRYIEQVIEENEDIKAGLMFIQKWWRNQFRLRARRTQWKIDNKRMHTKIITNLNKENIDYIFFVYRNGERMWAELYAINENFHPLSYEFDYERNEQYKDKEDTILSDMVIDIRKRIFRHQDDEEDDILEKSIPRPKIEIEAQQLRPHESQSNQARSELTMERTTSLENREIELRRNQSQLKSSLFISSNPAGNIQVHEQQEPQNQNPPEKDSMLNSEKTIKKSIPNQHHEAVNSVEGQAGSDGEQNHPEKLDQIPTMTQIQKPVLTIETGSRNPTKRSEDNEGSPLIPSNPNEVPQAVDTVQEDHVSPDNIEKKEEKTKKHNEAVKEENSKNKLLNFIESDDGFEIDENLEDSAFSNQSGFKMVRKSSN